MSTFPFRKVKYVLISRFRNLLELSTFNTYIFMVLKEYCRLACFPSKDRLQNTRTNPNLFSFLYCNFCSMNNPKPSIVLSSSYFCCNLHIKQNQYQRQMAIKNYHIYKPHLQHFISHKSFCEFSNRLSGKHGYN